MRVLCARDFSIGGSPSRPGPVSLGQTFCKRIKILLTDAETAEDLSEQLVGVELTRDRTESPMRQPQLLGKKLPSAFSGGEFEVAARFVQRPQVTLAREVNR